MIWQYGITTQEVRRHDLLPKTLDSLAIAGFDNPTLFVDGSKDVLGYEKQFCLSTTVRYPRVGNYGNWILSAWTLWILNPFADRYAIFEDDFVTVPDLKEYLESLPYPQKGYLNLFTVKANLSNLHGRRTLLGWHASDQWGKGAVALVFDNLAMKTLLGHEGTACHPQEWKREQVPIENRVGLRKVDGLIVTVMNKAGFKEYVHNPSLVYHTGISSSMGSNCKSNGDTFKGESFKMMSLLPTAKTFG